MGVALIRSEVETQQETRQERPRVTRSRRNHRGTVSEVALLAAPVVNVYQTPDGEMHHAWCHQPLHYHGRRAALELDFYCLRCVEHVTIPESTLSRIPVRAPFAQV